MHLARKFWPKYTHYLNGLFLKVSNGWFKLELHEMERGELGKNKVVPDE
jgi:hypothetical protein